MSSANDSVDDTMLSFYIDHKQFFEVQFWIFLLLIIPSIICSLFGLNVFLRDRVLRQAPHNHVIIALLGINLFFELTDMPCFLHYFRCFLSFLPPPGFRLAWGYIDNTGFTLQIILFAWITIERHILIFHNHLIATAKKLVFIHYAPPIILTIYCVVYYATIYFAIPCKNNFDNIVLPGFAPCAFQNGILYLYEVIVHGILPILIIILASIILLLRILLQKCRANQQFQWRRYRLMAVQVLSISCIYLIFPFPYIIVIILMLCGFSSDIAMAFLSYAGFFAYYNLIIVPIVVVGTLPELRKKLKQALQCQRQRRRNAVGPQILTTGQRTRSHMKTVT